ncbi:MAG: HesA/MoeB/ThiF family protein [Magnetococcales bacterium]|nr:HesA/MoeB/ThiF family protein [Magnetococcales bacterium]
MGQSLVPTATTDFNVVILGMGGLGSVVAMALVAAGIRHLTLIDADCVALSNLHRQPLYLEQDIGQRKVEIAAQRLTAMAPDCTITTHPLRMETMGQLLPLALTHACMVDASDNFATRFLANDAALASGRPLVHGAATGLKGQLMTILPFQSSCLRCLFDAPPDVQVATCQEAGILGPLVQEIGWLMAIECIKLQTGAANLLTNALLTVNLETGVRRQIALARQSDCSGCTNSDMTNNQ